MSESVGGKFLNDMLAPVATGIGNSVSKALFGDQTRVSNRDNQHNQNLLDQNNPRDIARQSKFLEGIAPSQAAAYNTYQDATYGAETGRHVDRVKTMSTSLGMSPWEIVGGSSGAQPAPAVQGRSAPDQQGQAATTSLAIAKMNNQTALAQTAMQTDSAQKIAAQQTFGGKVPEAAYLEAGDRMRGMALDREGKKLANELAEIAKTFQMGAIEKQSQETQNLEQARGLSLVAQLYQMLPKHELDTGLGKSEWREGWTRLAGELNRSASGLDPKKLASSLGPSVVEGMMSDMLMMVGGAAKAVKTATSAAHDAMGAWSMGKSFLGGLKKK